MKTRRKLRQRRLALNMADPLHPVSYERGKELFAQIRAGLQAGIHDTRNPRQ